jgi:phage/plasmid-like protein (TIGR03299 family)
MLATLNGIGHDAENITSVGEALERNGLNWSVEKRPTFFKKNDGQLASMGTSFATVRSDNEAMLGRVGGDYVPMSNADALQHVDALLISGAATLDSVFELKGGKRVGASLKLKDSINIKGEDLIDMYITVTTSHDGTRADRTEITPIRLYCTNQLAVISKTAKQSWSVRHLSTMADNLKVVEEELKLITNYAQWFETMANDLIEKTITEMELTNILLDSLNFIKEDERKLKIKGDIIDVFKYSNLIGDQFKGTAWGGFNAATEYFDHHRNYRTSNARYNSITNGIGARVRNSVAESLLSI